VKRASAEGWDSVPKWQLVIGEWARRVEKHLPVKPDDHLEILQRQLTRSLRRSGSASRTTVFRTWHVADQLHDMGDFSNSSNSWLRLWIACGSTSATKMSAPWWRSCSWQSVWTGSSQEDGTRLPLLLLRPPFAPVPVITGNGVCNLLADVWIGGISGVPRTLPVAA
jgi:hypothetical protein